MKKALFILISLFSVVLRSQTGGNCFSTFEDNNYHAGCTSTWPLVSADFNNDGYSDVISFCGAGNMSVMLGNSNGTLSSPNFISIGVNAYEAVTADFNNDGNEDLAFSNTTDTITVMLGTGTGSFSSPYYRQLSYGYYQIAVADFNEDSYPDLVAGTNNIPFTILIGDGLGHLFPLLSGSFTPTDLITNDFNNDGHQDVAIIQHTYNEIEVFFGNGMGAVAYGFSFPIPTNISQVYASDFNNDGKVDFIIPNNATNDIIVYLRSGSSVSAPIYTSLVTPGAAYKLTLNDMNTDGYIDVVTMDFNGGICVFLGNGTGSFTKKSAYFSMNSMGNGLCKGDINNDSKNDIIVANGTDDIQVYLSKGNGLLAGLPQNSVAGILNSFVSGDFNNDGFKDVITAGKSPYAITVLSGNGTQSMTVTNSIPVVNSIKSIATTDLNNDNFLDIVTANDTSNNISIYINNGGGNFLSPVNYASATGNPSLMNLSDVNNDGNVDVVTIGNSINVFKGVGNGTFLAPLSYTSSISVLCFKIVDVNNDNIKDIVLGGIGGYNVMLGSIAGTYTTTHFNLTGITSNAFTLDMDDLNNDGNQDLVVGGYAGSYSMSALLGNGAGTFSLTSAYPGAGKYVKIKDINYDGNKDILVTQNSPYGAIVLYSGLGNGNFTSTLYRVVGPLLVDATDFNNDGYEDIAILQTDNVTLFFNNAAAIVGVGSPTVCPGTVLNASGTNCNYLWQPGGVTTNTMAVNNSGTYSVTISSQGGGCVSTSNGYIITVDPALSPTLSISSSSPTVCVGTGNTLTVTGANSYSWTPALQLSASTGSVVISTPTITTNYTVTGKDLNNCGNTQTITVVIDNTCTDVWPGDANSDGVADNLDVLELGLHYTQVGSSRASMSNNWQPYFANNWIGTITNGKNLNHSDCNGDGAIDDNDTLAIYNNYNLSHTFKPVQTTTVTPQLSIVPDQTSVVKGMWGTASIYLGDVTMSVNDINGVAFTVDFDNTLIDPNSIYIEYQNSFIDVSQNLYFRKLDFLNAKIYTATTHTISSNASGYGKIATLHYKILSSLTTDEILNIGLINANQSDSSGTIFPLSSGAGTLLALGSSVGIKNIADDNFMITPNPTNSFINIISGFDLSKIELLSITGQALLSEKVNTKTHQLQLQNFTEGIYFVRIIYADGLSTTKKVVVSR